MSLQASQRTVSENTAEQGASFQSNDSDSMWSFGIILCLRVYPCISQRSSYYQLRAFYFAWISHENTPLIKFCRDIIILPSLNGDIPLSYYTAGKIDSQKPTYHSFCFSLDCERKTFSSERNLSYLWQGVVSTLCTKINAISRKIGAIIHITL